MKNIKPNGQRAKLAILFTWILLGLGAASLMSSILQFGVLQSMARGEFVSDAAAEANDLREQIIGGLYFVIYLIWLISFLSWFYRAYANLQTKVAYPLSCKPGWAVGYWFIPILCLYRPYQTIKELYVDTRELFVNDGLSEKTALTTGYLGWWWALWLISVFVGNAVFRIAFRGENTLDGLISLTITQGVLEVFNILFALLSTIVIRDYSRVEPLLGEIDDKEETL